MTGLNKFFKLIIIAAFFAYDYNNGYAVAGLAFSVLYFMGATLSLLKGDRRLAKKRALLMLAFAAEAVAVTVLVEHPPELEIIDRIKNLGKL